VPGLKEVCRSSRQTLPLALASVACLQNIRRRFMSSGSTAGMGSSIFLRLASELVITAESYSHNKERFQHDLKPRFGAVSMEHSVGCWCQYRNKAISLFSGQQTHLLRVGSVRRTRRRFEKRNTGPSGLVYHCPYCIVGGQYRSMIPLDQSSEYRCGGCGHTVVENNPSYVCICSGCKAPTRNGATGVIF